MQSGKVGFDNDSQDVFDTTKGLWNAALREVAYLEAGSMTISGYPEKIEAFSLTIPEAKKSC